ncbi:MAG: dinitrogenase iron-molybdenum cofactor biosynthesis protein [Rhodocyclaceae bacterium]|nr:dinitrogenase iron-molybdenum cofactor biosynthesis protein [Rhodocyclaceae bacterium]
MDKPTRRIAVASKEGLAVSEHFGHARRFLVYEVRDPEVSLLETREVDHYCHGHLGSAPAMERILHTVRDCDAVLIARIGDGPAEKLAAIGVTAISDYAYNDITESLLDFVRRSPA